MLIIGWQSSSGSSHRGSWSGLTQAGCWGQMARRELNLDEEKRSYAGVWLLAAILLVVGAVWSILDDSFFRRPWKAFQNEFFRIEEQKERTALEGEQTKKLSADSKQRRARSARGSAAEPFDGRNRRSRWRRRSRSSPRRNSRSTTPTSRYASSRASSRRPGTTTTRRSRRVATSMGAQAPRRAGRREGEVRGQSGTRPGRRREASGGDRGAARSGRHPREADEGARGGARAHRHQARRHEVDHRTRSPSRASRRSSRSSCRTSTSTTSRSRSRVDCCTSCHMGIDKAGFEDLEQPHRTHPKRDPLLLEAPVEVRLHAVPRGQGVALNTVAQAHGEVPFWGTRC